MDNYGESNRLQVANPHTLPVSTSELHLLLGKVIVRPTSARHTGPRGCLRASLFQEPSPPHTTGPIDCVGGGLQSKARLLASLSFITQRDTSAPTEGLEVKTQRTLGNSTSISALRALPISHSHLSQAEWNLDLRKQELTVRHEGRWGENWERRAKSNSWIQAHNSIKPQGCTHASKSASGAWVSVRVRA